MVGPKASPGSRWRTPPRSSLSRTNFSSPSSCSASSKGLGRRPYPLPGRAPRAPPRPGDRNSTSHSLDRAGTATRSRPDSILLADGLSVVAVSSDGSHQHGIPDLQAYPASSNPSRTKKSPGPAGGRPLAKVWRTVTCADRVGTVVRLPGHPSSPCRRVRARLTRLFIVPTAQPHRRLLRMKTRRRQSG